VSIRRTGGASPIGDNSYGFDQTAARIRTGTGISFDVRLDNDGTLPDTVAFFGCERPRGYVIRFFDATDVTNDVFVGYGVDLQPGESRVLTMRVRATQRAPRLFGCLLFAYSTELVDASGGYAGAEDDVGVIFRRI
jgi:hypothetical protein